MQQQARAVGVPGRGEKAADPHPLLCLSQRTFQGDEAPVWCLSWQGLEQGQQEQREGGQGPQKAVTDASS